MRRNAIFFRTVGSAVGLALGVMLHGGSLQGKASTKPPNVLFLVVDDLRPELPCYGKKQVVAPNIEVLAEAGFVFERAYCQVPVCGASRASLLTGLRPTRYRFLTYSTWAQRDAPGVVTLPEHFRRHGYITISLGKVFHHQQDSPQSWSEPAWRPRPEHGGRDYMLPRNIAIAKRRRGIGPAYECADVPDEAYRDGKIARRAMEELRRLKQEGKPFFLAVGFLKPHLPFNAPKRYWDLYPPGSVQPASNSYPPKDVPIQALHNWGELRAYYGIPKRGRLSDEMARTLVRGYYACISYTDAQIGRVLRELKRLGLWENTIIVLWGDHGWNLREHGLWCKHCLFETSLHAPLIVRVPGLGEGQRTKALVEFLDIYPSLCELAGLPLPKHLDGKSFVPLLKDPTLPGKPAVFSRYHAGDSVKTDHFRYSFWTDRQGQRIAEMLYDHVVDPGENTNVVKVVKYHPVVQRLAQLLRNVKTHVPSKPRPISRRRRPAFRPYIR